MDVLSIYILIMAGITFSVRYLFFAKVLRFRLNRAMQDFLSFTAPCILTALLVPIVCNQPTAGKLFDPYLLAGLIAVATSLILKNVLAVVLISMAAFVALNFVA